MGLVCAKRDGKRGGYEHDLDCCARQKGRDWPAADGQSLAGSADVGRKETEDNKRQPGRRKP
jgi:hypothetical protein